MIACFLLMRAKILLCFVLLHQCKIYSSIRRAECLTEFIIGDAEVCTAANDGGDLCCGFNTMVEEEPLQRGFRLRFFHMWLFLLVLRVLLRFFLRGGRGHLRLDC